MSAPFRVAWPLAALCAIALAGPHCGGAQAPAPPGNTDAGTGSGGGVPDGSVGGSVDAGTGADGGGGGSVDAGGGSSADAGGGGSADAGGGGSADAGGGGSAACSQPGPAAVAARTYVIEPAGREPEYSAADESGNMVFGV